jgi:hypothetical protein
MKYTMLKYRKITTKITKKPTKRQMPNQMRRPQHQLKKKKAAKLLKEKKIKTVKDKEVGTVAPEEATEAVETTTKFKVAKKTASTVAVVVEEATIEVPAKTRTVSS